jgi:hypothetical protein
LNVAVQPFGWPGCFVLFVFFSGGFFILLYSRIFWFFYADFERLFLLCWLPFFDLGVSRVNMADCDVERELWFLAYFETPFDIFFIAFKVFIPSVSCLFNDLMSLYI